jgi:hypothetical protein
MKTRQYNRAAILLLTVLLGGLLLWSCSTREVKDPLSVTRFNVDEMSNLHGSGGVERTTFYNYETVFLSLENLYEHCETEIDIIHCGECDTAIKRLVVLSDIEGKITNLPIWYHVNTDSLGNFKDECGCYTVLVVQPNRDNPWINIAIPLTIACGLPPTPQIRSIRADGTFNGGAVLVGEPVNVEASAFTPGDSVLINVVPDQWAYADGDPIVDVTGVVDTVVVKPDGSIPFTQIWNAPAAVGSYDIVADLKPFGVFNAGDVVSDGLLTGVVVQQPPTPGVDIVTDIACDVVGNHKNVFDGLEPIYAWVNSPIRPAELGEEVSIFVTFHRDVWPLGLKLLNIETVGSLHQGTKCEANQFSENPRIIQVRGDAKPLYRRALRLWPGDYDVIVDINRNGVYDPGIDILDGGSQVGFSISDDGESQPLYKIIESSWDDLNFASSTAVEIRAQVVTTDGTPVPDVIVHFNVARGPGSVTPTSGITDINGIVTTIFDGSTPATPSIIRAFVDIDGIRYTARISQWGKCACAHNQGVGIID